MDGSIPKRSPTTALDTFENITLIISHDRATTTKAVSRQTVEEERLGGIARVLRQGRGTEVTENAARFRPQ